MRIDEGIRRRGFRRWYERQLYEAFAFLVTGLLALIMVAIALESLAARESFLGLVTLLAVGAAGGAICVGAWRKFTFLLFRAEYVAERATCPACRVYARFAVDTVDDAAGAFPGCTLHVQCRACAHRWSIG
jgi:hypothetical protein